MIIGIGTDIIEINRIEKAINRRASFLNRVFTVPEQEYCFARDNPWPSFAVRFAAKEGVMKALGVGFNQCSFNEIEILKAETGKPYLKLYHKAQKLATAQGVNFWHLSLSHNKTVGIAFVIAERRVDEQNLG